VLPAPRNAHQPTLVLLMMQLALLYATMMPHEPVRGQGSRLCLTANEGRRAAAYPLWYWVATDPVPPVAQSPGRAIVLRYEQLGRSVMGTPGPEDAESARRPLTAVLPESPPRSSCSGFWLQRGGWRSRVAPRDRNRFASASRCGVRRTGSLRHLAEHVLSDPSVTAKAL